MRRWRGTPTDLLICDDDRLQDRLWMHRFVEGRKLRPGRHPVRTRLDDRGTLRHDQRWNPTCRAPNTRRNRAARWPTGSSASPRSTSPIRRAASTRGPGHVEVFEGFLGALMPAEALPDEAFDIPEIVWTVDDVWLSGMAWKNGTKRLGQCHAPPGLFRRRGRQGRLAARPCRKGARAARTPISTPSSISARPTASGPERTTANAKGPPAAAPAPV